jgi:hypothetical protein
MCTDFFIVMNLQILIDKEKTILSKNALLGMDGGGDIAGKISHDADNRANFLLCPSCFWCASCLPSPMLRTMAAAKGSASLAKCPSCIEGNIESVPVAENEEYKFDYDIKRGVTMEFFR